MMIKMCDLNAYEFRAGDPVPEWLLEQMPKPGFKRLGQLIWQADVLVVEWVNVWHVVKREPGQPFILLDGAHGIELHATDLAVHLCPVNTQINHSGRDVEPFDWRKQKD